MQIAALWNQLGYKVHLLCPFAQWERDRIRLWWVPVLLDLAGTQVKLGTPLLCSFVPLFIPLQVGILKMSAWGDIAMFCCHIEAEKGTSSEKWNCLSCLAGKWSLKYSLLHYICICLLPWSKIIGDIRNTSVFHELSLHWYLLDVSKIL